MVPILEDLLRQLKEILSEIKSAAPATVELDLAPFFGDVRKTLFGGRLTTPQVKGMETKIKRALQEGYPLSWVAYMLATVYHETAKRMQPVREGLSASDAWRRRNLRYYPYYGRGDVQLTWAENYRKLGDLLGKDLIGNPDLALDPEISASVLVLGMKDGLFSKGHSLKVHLPNSPATRAEFKQSRRIINIMDKADMIAGYALKFQSALQKAGM